MASSYVNDLRLEEIGSGEQSGTWGDTTNTNLELIAEGLSYGTEAITTNANTHTSTVADGATDPARSMYIEYTGTLDSACTITIAPNTLSRMHFIENGTSGSQNIIIKQGSGATITIPPGDTKAVYLDGAGGGAAVVDAFASLSVVDLKVQDDLTVTDDVAIGGILGVTGVLTATAGAIFNGGLTTDGALLSGGTKLLFRDSGLFLNSSTDGQLDIDADTELELTAPTIQLVASTKVDLDGNLDVSGTTLVTGVLTTTAATVFNGGFTANDGSTITTNDNSVQLTLKSTDADASGGPILDLTRDSANPADGDVLGLIRFKGDDAGGNETAYAQIIGFIQDEAGGAEDGTLKIETLIAGGSQARLDFTLSETVFNEGSIDLDFRVESNNDANAFFVEGSTGNIGIGIAAPAGDFHMTDASDIRLLFTSDQTGNTSGDGTFIGLTDGGHFNIFNREATSIRMYTSGVERLSLTATGALLVGEIREQTQGGIISQTMVSEDSTMTIMCRSATDGHTPVLTMMKTPATSGNFTATGSGDFLGLIQFKGVNTSAVADVGAAIRVKQTGTASGTVPASMQFFTNEAERLIIEEDGNIAINGAGVSFVATNSYHVRIVNTANQTSQLNFNSNASFTQDLHAWDTIRAGTDAFNFGRWRTNVGGSPDSEFIFNGAGSAFADGAWNGGGADYAEYFEWADGNPSSQDRVGVSVKLDGTKIVASTSSDDASAIIGVISANPSVVGDTAGLRWQSKYERDDYNRYVWEAYTFTEWTIPATETEEAIHHIYPTDYIPSGVTVPSDAVVISKDDDNKNLMRKKLNSSFDESVTYVPRSDRKEWDTVGLMGKLRMTKGQKTGTNWIKMKDISDTVEEWLVR